MQKSARSLAGLPNFGPLRPKMTLRVDQPNTVIVDRVWGAVNLCKTPYSATNEYNTRNGSEALIVGFMQNISWRNITTAIQHVYEYWIVPVNGGISLTDANLQDDLYTRHGTALDQDGSWSTILPAILYDEPINSEKWRVLKKRKTILGPLTGGVTDRQATNLPSFKQMKTWVPLRRKYTYGQSANDGEDPEEPLQGSVYWINFVVTQHSNGSSAAGAVERTVHMVTYFRDGNSGMDSK